MRGELDDEAATIHKGIEEEAVRLVATSGRAQRAVAEDMGVGLSTLVRWVGRSRDRLTQLPDEAPAARE